MATGLVQAPAMERKSELHPDYGLTTGRKHSKKQRNKAPKEHAPQQNLPESARSLALKELRRDLSRSERIAEIKGQIAEIGTGLLSDPENKIQSLKELFNFCHDEDVWVVNLAMLSLLAIFRDLAPGYRIRLPTLKELEMQVSKEVRKLRDFETTLLHFYQKYVQRLISLVKIDSHAKVALKCMCGLLQALPHFNYRDSILATIIPNMNSSVDECSALCCEAIRSLFTNETKHGGRATVEAVQLLADFVKTNNCLLRPETIEVLLALSFDDNLNTSAVPDSKRNDIRKSIKGIKRAQKQISKQDNMKKSKKHELAEKVREEVIADFKAASAIPEESDRRGLQTSTLTALFETYFRILKTSLEQLERINNFKNKDVQYILTRFGPRPLLRPCLEGLGKFSHLISIDFMGDLLGILRKLAANIVPQRGAQEDVFGTCLSVIERLQCCIVAFTIVRSNFDALNIDLRDFHTHFYNLLLEYDPIRGENIMAVLAEGLQVILWEARQHDNQRVAAFIKRLTSISLHLGSAETIAALVTVRHLLQRHKRCQNLLDNDEGGGVVGGTLAVYQATVQDPELSGALSSVLWETTLLHRHYHPGVAKLASQISELTNLEEIFSATMSPKDAVVAYSTLTGGFRPPVQPPRKQIKRKSYLNQISSSPEGELRNDSQASLSHFDENIEESFSSYFSTTKAIQENEKLRKELRKLVMMLDLHKEFKAKRRKLKKKKS